MSKISLSRGFYLRKLLEMNEHPSSIIPIKFADIDIKIQPLILWLNKFDSICTLYCCQGDTKIGNYDDELAGSMGYVMFTCSDMRDLSYIGNLLENFVQWEVSFHESATIRFTIRWNYDHFYEIMDIIVRETNKRKHGTLVNDTTIF